MNDLSKILVVMGGALIALGILVWFFGKIPGVGRLPGDIFVRKENFTFYFPLTTSILISIALTFVFLFLGKR